MFQALRQGSPFYVLQKGNEINLKVGRVESVSLPQPKFSTYPPYSQESTVDIKVKVDDDMLEFNQVPGNLSIANFGTSNVVISESKDEMMREVDGMLQSSRQALASVEYHKKVMDACEGIVKQLNPAYAKEQERDETLSSLQNEVATIKDSLEQILKSLPKS